MFEKYGKITSHKVMVDDQNVSRGFGFVSYEAPESAEHVRTLLKVPTWILSKFRYSFDAVD